MRAMPVDTKHALSTCPQVKLLHFVLKTPIKVTYVLIKTVNKVRQIMTRSSCPDAVALELLPGPT